MLCDKYGQIEKQKSWLFRAFVFLEVLKENCPVGFCFRDSRAFSVLPKLAKNSLVPLKGSGENFALRLRSLIESDVLPPSSITGTI